jgi:cellulose biosynthesis protein BcsQ
MKVFATFNIKGGVGKTASAVNLAYLSSVAGARTLIWDLDPQSSATFYLRIRAKIKGGSKGLIKGKRQIDSLIRGSDFENLDLLPADFSYRKLDLLINQTKNPFKSLARLIKPLSLEYDHLFLDCAPGITLVSESVFEAADVLLIPTIPTVLSLRTLNQLATYLKKKRLNQLKVWPFFCMVDRRKSLHRQIAELNEDCPFDLLMTRIPYASVVERMGVHRAPLHTFASTTPAARAYSLLWDEIQLRISSRYLSSQNWPAQYV